MLLEGVGKQHLLKTKPEAEPLVQCAHPDENTNDVHVNMNRVDPRIRKELVNQWGERESQPLTSMDFRLVDVIYLPLVHVCTSHDLGAQGGKGDANLRGEGILPSKGICAGLPDKFDPGNNVVGVWARENFTGRRGRKGWFLTRTTFGKTFVICHLVSSFESLPERCLGRQARKSSGLDIQNNNNN